MPPEHLELEVGHDKQQKALSNSGKILIHPTLRLICSEWAPFLSTYLLYKAIPCKNIILTAMLEGGFKSTNILSCYESSSGCLFPEYNFMQCS